MRCNDRLGASRRLSADVPPSHSFFFRNVQWMVYMPGARDKALSIVGRRYRNSPSLDRDRSLRRRIIRLCLYQRCIDYVFRIAMDILSDFYLHLRTLYSNGISIKEIFSLLHSSHLCNLATGSAVRNFAYTECSRHLMKKISSIF